MALTLDFAKISKKKLPPPGSATAKAMHRIQRVEKIYSFFTRKSEKAREFYISPGKLCQIIRNIFDMKIVKKIVVWYIDLFFFKIESS